MTTKANRTRSAAKQAEKKIAEAKKRYGLEPGTGAAILRMAMTFAESPWALVAALAALVACVVVLAL